MMVAVIDDGINASVFGKLDVKHDLTVMPDGSISNRTSTDYITTTHGTICAGIISKYAPHTKFCSIRIFHNEILTSTLTQLVAALEWCVEYNVPIIHMSVGTTQPSDFGAVKKIFARLFQNNQVVIAACNNTMQFTLPADLYGVFGVVADKELVGDNYYFSSNAHLECGRIHASSKHVINTLNNTSYFTPVSNSFAAPTVTAVISNLLENVDEKFLPIPRIVQKLANREDYVWFARPDFLNNVAVINPDGRPMLKQHFFFNVRNEHSSFAGTCALDRFISQIVYLPSRSPIINKKFLYALSKMNDNRISLVYGGEMTEPKPTNESIDFWCEDNCYCPLYSTNDAPISQPVIINVVGNGVEIINIVCRLRDFFSLDGYHCRCLCNYPHSYLYGLEYLPDRSMSFNYLRQILQHYHPDVIIHNIQYSNCISPEFSSDYSIYVNDTCNISHAFHQSFICKNICQDDILQLYKVILDSLVT